MKSRKGGRRSRIAFRKRWMHSLRTPTPTCMRRRARRMLKRSGLSAWSPPPTPRAQHRSRPRSEDGRLNSTSGHGVRRLFVPTDNDEVGRAFAEEKARALAGIVPDIRIVEFPDVPEKLDVTYWLEHDHHTKAEYLARCEAAPRWQD